MTISTHRSAAWTKSPRLLRALKIMAEAASTPSKPYVAKASGGGFVIFRPDAPTTSEPADASAELDRALDPMTFRR